MKEVSKGLKLFLNNRLLVIWFICLAIVSYYMCVHDSDNKPQIQGNIPNNKTNKTNRNNFTIHEGFTNRGPQKPLTKTPSNKTGKCGNLKEATKKCTQCHGVDGKPLLPVLEPMFNMREMCKQIILLEDHLFQSGKRCEDCICKHFLTIEALAEEAVTLDKEGKYSSYLEKLPDRIRKIQAEYIDNKGDIRPIAQKLRVIRKEMMVKSFKMGLKTIDDDVNNSQ